MTCPRCGSTHLHADLDGDYYCLGCFHTVSFKAAPAIPTHADLLRDGHEDAGRTAAHRRAKTDYRKGERYLQYQDARYPNAVREEMQLALEEAAS